MGTLVYFSCQRFALDGSHVDHEVPTAIDVLEKLIHGRFVAFSVGFRGDNGHIIPFLGFSW